MRDKMILGENAEFSTDSEVTGVNNNVIVCAGSGCGKTLSIMDPRLLNTYDSSLIVTVTKRRLVHQYTQMFKNRGYKVLDLNFVKPQSSNVTFDPLHYIKSYTDITFLAESIVKANPRKEYTTADPFWDDNSTSLLSALIAYVMGESKSSTFDDVIELFTQMKIEESGTGIKTNLDSKLDKSNTFAYNRWRSFRSLPMKTASCVFSTLSTTLDMMFTPELRKIMRSQTTVNFENIAKEKTVLFVTTSAVNPALNLFVNMFYAQAIKQLFEIGENMPDGKLPIPVSILCDDFATGSRILNFPEYISIFREKGISVTLLVQSESQLVSIYGAENATTIINNCDTYVYMGGMDIKTARNISERINLPLEDVMYMPVGDVMIFRRGQRPIMTTRYDIYHDREFIAVKEAYDHSVKIMDDLLKKAASAQIPTSSK
jgi:type IV secretory pathway TraG/TraD family ATPase VirD4